MAHKEDGTDGSGAPRLNNNRVSGKEPGTYGKTASKGISNSAKTLSGNSDGSYGTKGVKGQTGKNGPTDANTDRSQISKTGGRF